MNITNANPQRRVLTVFSLAMITMGSVDSIRNLPSTALFGTSLVFFFLFAGIFFLIPCALVSAELSSSSIGEGGVYRWVKKAFGDRWGFAAIWFQWLENVVWYPTILSFVAGGIAYLVSPQLAHNKYFLVAVILITFWGTTIINLLGVKSSAWFANFCGIGGLIIPMALIILLGIIWIVNGHPVNIHFTAQDIFPNFSQPSAWIALTGIMLSYGGMEIATVYAKDTKDPQRAFPKALMISAIFICSTLILGSLTVAVVLPVQEISLVAGVMQVFAAFLAAYHLSGLLPLLAILIVIGALGGVSNWIMAPVKGLLIAAHDRNLPQHFAKENKFGAPGRLLIYQASIVSLLSLAFLLMPSVNAAYWLLTALTSQIYVLMYILMFAAGIRLRYTHREEKRAFKVPGGSFGMWLAGGMGILACIITVIVGFFPPDQIPVGSLAQYEGLLISGLLIVVVLPFIFQALKRK